MPSHAIILRKKSKEQPQFSCLPSGSASSKEKSSWPIEDKRNSKDTAFSYSNSTFNKVVNTPVIDLEVCFLLPESI